MFIKKIMYALCLAASLLGVSMQSGWGVKPTLEKVKKDNDKITLFNEEELRRLTLKLSTRIQEADQLKFECEKTLTGDQLLSDIEKAHFDYIGNIVLKLNGRNTNFLYPPIIDYFLDIIPYNSTEYNLLIKNSSCSDRTSGSTHIYSRKELADFFKIQDNKGIVSIFLKDYAFAIGISIATMFVFAFQIACYIVNKKFTQEQLETLRNNGWLGKPLAWLASTMKNIDATISKNKTREFLAGILITIAILIINGSAWGINGYLVKKKYSIRLPDGF